jgi:hypothetical protein
MSNRGMEDGKRLDKQIQTPLVMIKAIRIEANDGIGVFLSRYKNQNRLSLDHLGLWEAVNRHQQFNTPTYDGLAIFEYEFCAYHSIKQLRTWFTPDELYIILTHGYRVYELTLLTAKVGRDNIVFNKNNIISKIDISDQII